MGKAIRFGVIGAAYMGKAYAIALSSVSTVFELPRRARLEMIATTDEKGAARKAAAFGFARSTGDWRKLVADPDVDVVGIGSPTFLHKEMALATIAAGKAVLCEKPLSLSASDANDMALAAERAGVKTLVGFNYMRNPASQLAKQMFDAGEIGEIIHFRGTHNEDYLMDPSSPMNWRLKAEFASRAGALCDLASHIVNLAHYLCGPIAEVVGESQTVHKSRPAEGGAMEAVENDDQTNFLAKFACGALGSFEASRIAAGRKMGLTYEVIGTKGALFFDQERLSELQFYSTADESNRRGYRTLLIGPEHPEYGAFCIGAGHGFGYNDMIVVEIKDMILGVTEGKPLWPTFRDAVHTASVVDAVLRSQDERRWVLVSEIAKEFSR